MFNYKVEFSYLPGIAKNRIRQSVVCTAESCQEAANMARWGHCQLDGMRVERIWKETVTGSWMAVNAWR